MLFNLISSAQDYKSLPTGPAKWEGTLIWYANHLIDNSVDEFYSTKKIQTGITKIIDSVEYRVISIFEDSYNYLIPDTLYIREEGEKIFYRDKSFLNERILYDFTLNEGDTFIFHSPLYEDSTLFWIEHIDSILVGNSYHKRHYIYDITHSWTDLVFIEGVGSNYDLFYPYYPDFYFHLSGSAVVLNCFQNEDTSYQTQLYYYNDIEYFYPSNNCSLLLSTTEKDFHKPYDFSYNSNEIFITLNNNKYSSIQVSLIDVLGRKYYGETGFENNYQINIRNLPSGVYYIEVKVNENTFHSIFTKS